jgi:hypothetical protein
MGIRAPGTFLTSGFLGAFEGLQRLAPPLRPPPYFSMGALTRFPHSVQDPS